jgi:aminopeptidase YwaD
MKRSLKLYFLAAALFCSTVVSANAQKSTIEERNVRAQMDFLAGDAMQGRGSGTQFERIAAEYVGSQFMQFGLQPAGENRWDGKPGYVQTVAIARRTFAENPFLKFGSTSLGHGKEMAVLRTNTDAARGELQKLADGEKPKPGAAVFVRAKEGEDQRAFIQRAQAMAAAGAYIVFIEETPQIRSNWGNFANRTPSFTSTGAKPAVIVVISKDAVTAIESAPVGTKFEFAGRLAPGQDQNT